MGMGWPVPHRCRIGTHAYILWSDGPVGKKKPNLFNPNKLCNYLFVCCFDDSFKISVVEMTRSPCDVAKF